LLIFVHLFIGAVVGIAIARVIHDNRAIYASILGSGISDFVDKPIGYIFPVLDSGRTVFHTLFIAAVFAVAGFLLWKYHRNIIVLAMAACIFLHQVTDIMWKTPEWWFWPFGHIVPNHFIDAAYFGNFFMIEITSLSEWVFGIVILLIICDEIYKNKILPWILCVATAVVAFIGIWSLWCGGIGIPCYLTPILDPYGNLTIGVIAVVGSEIFATLLFLKYIMGKREDFDRVSQKW